MLTPRTLRRWTALAIRLAALMAGAAVGGSGALAAAGAASLTLHPPALPNGIPVLTVHQSDRVRVRIFEAASDDAPGRGPGMRLLSPAVEQPTFGGTRNVVYLIDNGPEGARALRAEIEQPRGAAAPTFSFETLQHALARGAAHSHMIALACGALLAMALAALSMWVILSDRMFVLYAGFICMLALYLACFSGEARGWPWLAAVARVEPYSWNVPVALAGAAAALFVREIADLGLFVPRAHRLFGALAALFVLLAAANVLRLFGLGPLVSAAGNLLFVGSAVLTLVVALIAWRRGSRAAGWFLVAWSLLEAFTIAAAGRLLVSRAGQNEMLVYYGLPLSMVAAAVLIALGVADRLRAQRRALTEAERYARTDPLTGVLNRRSLLEQLDGACRRARVSGLPLALLFIDLDHFKRINDSFGHLAGDACLAAIIGPIQSELRQSDAIGRYGGEEFVVILNGADEAAAHPIAERIVRRVASVSVEGFGAPIQLTCSIGVAASDTLGVWGEQLIRHADAAVYGAKRSGRNRVQIAEPLAA
ncbi:MAG: sensor domain-containing diguanylate cyclase [Steroidobacteraceae bacterium]